MKVLLKEYGSYSSLPRQITGCILEITEHSMSEALRSKNKPIGHLPISAEYKQIEVDLSNLVTFKTYELFEKQIRSREHLREKRKELEAKYNEKARQIQERKHEHYMRTKIVVNTLKKTKLVPEWVAHSEKEDRAWFARDGKDEHQPQGILQSQEETKQESNVVISEPKHHFEGVGEDNSNDVWSEFSITPAVADEEHFPALTKAHE